MSTCAIDNTLRSDFSTEDSPIMSPKTGSPRKKIKQTVDSVAMSQFAQMVKPDFSQQFGGSIPDPISKQMPPAAPRKKAPPERAGAKSLFEMQYDNLQSGSFTYQQHEFTASCMPGGRGSYSVVYSVADSENRLVEGLNNSELVVKVFHGEIQTGFSEKFLKKYLEKAAENYRAVVALGLPVATIYNIDTTKTDGCVIQKKISHKIEVSALNQIKQVRKFFALSVENDVCMDLVPENLRVDNNKVVLLDFVEQKNIVINLITRACREWITLCSSRREALSLLRELTADFLYKKPGYTQEWFDSIIIPRPEDKLSVIEELPRRGIIETIRRLVAYCLQAFYDLRRP